MQLTNIEDETATDGGDESSLVASPKTEAKDDPSSPPSKDKVVAKRKQIKWDLDEGGGQQITEEQQIKEAKKVCGCIAPGLEGREYGLCYQNGFYFDFSAPGKEVETRAVTSQDSNHYFQNWK